MAIYIPNKLRVGYQKREDTFTKRLAYVIYYDNFGKLRKQASWESWRDDKIEPEEYENVPTSGFVLNKGHTRYNWSHFGNSKTVRIRIFDPRGIEFEITAENLVAVLMHTDCSRREITGELVYAWNEYKKSKEHIFVAEEQWPGYGADEEIGKHHFKPLSPSAALATLVTEEIPDGFAKMVDKYLKKSKHSSPVSHFTIDPPVRQHDGGYEYEICDDGKKAIRWRYRDGRYGFSWYSSRRDEHGHKIGWEEEHVYTTTHTEFGRRFSTERPLLKKGRLVAHFENGAKDERW